MEKKKRKKEGGKGRTLNNESFTFVEQGPVAWSDEHSPDMQMVAVSILGSGNILYSFVETGHEIISMAILSLPLIQAGQLSVTGQRMCTLYWLTA